MHDWSQTAKQLSLVANANRDPQKHGPYYAVDFVPADLRSEFCISRGIRITKSSLHALKPLFVGKKGN